jgi:hypothetical protein
MEAMKLKSSSGLAKAAGITLCLAGVLAIALYAGPLLSPLNRHRVLAGHGSKKAAAAHGAVSKGLWVTATFLMLLACVAWSLWFIFQVNQFLLFFLLFFFIHSSVVQGLLLKEYPNKLLAALIQCLFVTIQSFVVVVAMERDHGFSRWKLGLDLSLVAVAYSVRHLKYSVAPSISCRHGAWA